MGKLFRHVLGQVAAQQANEKGVEPAATAVGLVFFFGYLTVRAFNASYVWYAPYISPAVAPAVFTPAAGYPGPFRSNTPGWARSRHGGRRSCCCISSSRVSRPPPLDCAHQRSWEFSDHRSYCAFR
jgi:hypothetical protein